MKGMLSKVILLVSLVVLPLGIGIVILVDRQAWITGRSLCEALHDSETVILVQYTGEKEIARKTASAEEISQLRKAVNSWWRPFVPGQGTLSFVPHHRIEVVRRDGSKVTGLISFVCEQFMIDQETVPAPLPPHMNKSLSSVFISLGMAPKTYDEYRALEDVSDGSNDPEGSSSQTE